MQNLLTNLSNTINRDLHIPVISKEITITEQNQNTSCKKVSLKSTASTIFAFSLDYKFPNGKQMFPFFEQSLANITKVNDCIIFYVCKKKIHVFLVELKSKNLCDYKKQLQAGNNFINYLIRMMNLTFEKKYDILSEDIKCLVFTTRCMPTKQGTRRKKIKFTEINQLNISYHPCGDTFYLENFV